MKIEVVVVEERGVIAAALLALLQQERDIKANIFTGNPYDPGGPGGPGGPGVSGGPGGPGGPGAAKRPAHRGESQRPNIVLYSVQQPSTASVREAAAVKESLRCGRILLLADEGSPELLRTPLAEELSGFILNDAPPDRLIEAVRSVAEGRRVLDPRIAGLAWDRTANPLTPRESEVLTMAASGAQASEIAHELYLSVGTVRNYLSSAVVKLNGRNRVDAIRIARGAGWL